MHFNQVWIRLKEGENEWHKMIVQSTFLSALKLFGYLDTLAHKGLMFTSMQSCKPLVPSLFIRCIDIEQAIFVHDLEEVASMVRVCNPKSSCQNLETKIRPWRFADIKLPQPSNVFWRSYIVLSSHKPCVYYLNHHGSYPKEPLKEKGVA